MYVGLVILMILGGIVFIGSVLLMSPKGGIGLGIGGFGGGNEYGSKKSLEGKIKYVAIIAAVIFLISSIILPYSK
ncbi:MAG: preprotein translocase subunit SecG [Candidatus Absconditabacteria bacterium]